LGEDVFDDVTIILGSGPDFFGTVGLGVLVEEEEEEDGAEEEVDAVAVVEDDEEEEEELVEEGEGVGGLGRKSSSFNSNAVAVNPAVFACC
jgi:hypothetical protein